MAITKDKICVTLDHTLVAKLKNEAKKQNRSVSNLIELFIKEKMEK